MQHGGRANGRFKPRFESFGPVSRTDFYAEFLQGETATFRRSWASGLIRVENPLPVIRMLLYRRFRAINDGRYYCVVGSRQVDTLVVHSTPPTIDNLELLSLNSAETSCSLLQHIMFSTLICVADVDAT